MALLLAAVALALSACDSPCTRLADRLCAESKSDEACERWRARTGRVPTSTCEAGLRVLDKEAFR